MSRLQKKIRIHNTGIICIILLTDLSIRYFTSNTSTKTTDELNKLLVTSKINLKTLITNASNITPLIKLDYIVVHLDFKGMPPKLSYLKSLLPMTSTVC